MLRTPGLLPATFPCSSSGPFQAGKASHLHELLLLTVLHVLRAVQFIVHLGKLILQVPDLSLVLLPLHLHLEKPQREEEESVLERPALLCRLHPTSVIKSPQRLQGSRVHSGQRGKREVAREVNEWKKRINSAR